MGEGSPSPEHNQRAASNPFRGPVYFCVTPLGPPEDTGYSHALVALAEGLRELGVPTCANIDAWRESSEAGETLFRQRPGVRPEDCPVVVMDNCWTYHGRPLPDWLADHRRGFRACFFDYEDAYPSISTREPFRRFDFVFRPHWSAAERHPDNFRRWAFGPTGRILRETNRAPAFAGRERRVFVSHRVAHPLRTRANTRFLEPLARRLPLHRHADDFVPPEDAYHRLQWHQTGRRHHPAYYEELGRSRAAACFGGKLDGPPLTGISPPRSAWRRLRIRLGLTEDRLVQWDSFRLWEAWCSGAVTLHLDLARHGALLPEMPVNGVHYLGVDLDRPEEAIERLCDDDEGIARIAAAGRSWALEHYHPAAVARRLLRTIGC